MKRLSWNELWEKERAMARLVASRAHELWIKIQKDDIFFLASGLAFNVLLCLLPILLLLVYVAGLWCQNTETIRLVDSMLNAAFPGQPQAIEIRKAVSSILAEVVAQGSSFGILSVGVLLTGSASLFSTMRTALHRVFDVQRERHFLASYIIDLILSLGLTLLIVMTMLLNWFSKGLRMFQDDLLRMKVLPNLVVYLGAIPDFLSVFLIIIFCFLLYHYVPVGRTPLKAAFLGGTITGIIWEVSSRVFAWYLSTLTSLSKLYGTYAFIIVLLLWTYYSCFIFIVGAEIGHLLYHTKKGRDDHP